MLYDLLSYNQKNHRNNGHNSQAGMNENFN
jgi:pullulanase/glycogen debranching enzyme